MTDVIFSLGEKRRELPVLKKNFFYVAHSIFLFLKKNVTLIVFAVQHRKNTPINQAFRKANTLKKTESRVVRTCKTTNGKQYKLSYLRLLTTVIK